MEWFFIEALFALAVGIAIVWWTMAPRRKSPRDGEKKLSDGRSDDKSGEQSGDTADGAARRKKV
jgi:hypothetical protein